MDIGDPSSLVGILAVFGLVSVVVWRLVIWVRDTPVRPDPWDKENAVQPPAEPKTVDISAECSPEPPPTA